MGNRLYIRVTKDSNNNIKRELIHNGEKIDEVSFVELIEFAMQFMSSARFEGTK